MSNHSGFTVVRTTGQDEGILLQHCTININPKPQEGCIEILIKRGTWERRIKSPGVFITNDHPHVHNFFLSDILASSAQQTSPLCLWRGVAKRLCICDSLCTCLTRLRLRCEMKSIED